MKSRARFFATVAVGIVSVATTVGIWSVRRPIYFGFVDQGERCRIGVESGRLVVDNEPEIAARKRQYDLDRKATELLAARSLDLMASPPLRLPAGRSRSSRAVLPAIGLMSLSVFLGLR